MFLRIIGLIVACVLGGAVGYAFANTWEIWGLVASLPTSFIIGTGIAALISR